MEQKHTPEPWVEDPMNTLSLTDTTGDLICQFNGKSREESLANRTRARVCVNACAVLTNEEVIALPAKIKRIAELEDLLCEARNQIEYLHHKFKETGTGNSVIARIDNILKP